MSTITVDCLPDNFTIVRDWVYARHDLSPAARLVLGWIVGRGPGYQLRVSTIQNTHALSEKVWIRVRDELKKAGFFFSKRWRDEATGEIRWEHTVTDRPARSESPSPTAHSLSKRQPQRQAQPFRAVQQQQQQLQAVQPQPVKAQAVQESQPQIQQPFQAEELPQAASPVPASDFQLPEKFEESRSIIRRIATISKLNSEQTQTLADEFVGRQLDNTVDKIKVPGSWLRTTAQSVKDGEKSNWALSIERRREARRAEILARKSEQQKAQDFEEGKRLSMSQIADMLPAAFRRGSSSS